MQKKSLSEGSKMIDATCKYFNSFKTASLMAAKSSSPVINTPTFSSNNMQLSADAATVTSNTVHNFSVPTSMNSTAAVAAAVNIIHHTNNELYASMSASANYYNNKMVAMPSIACSNTVAAVAAVAAATALKSEIDYPPQVSSTGSMSPNSSNQSAPSSASVSPKSFSSPDQAFPMITCSPTDSTTSTSPHLPELGPVAANTHKWNTAAVAYTTAANLPARTQFHYAQYPGEYYGNVTQAGATWIPQWSPQTYPAFNFEDLAFQSQLQRRSVRCACPNCTNEMSGLPPIVGPDERGRKQHICHIPGCERLYGKASHLKTHLRWHTGERPFLCLTCGKRFSRSDELQRHGRTHTNYRPYACPICSKKFSRSDHLSKHKKTHFKDKKTKKVLLAEAKQQTQIRGEKSIGSDKIILRTNIIASKSVKKDSTKPNNATGRASINSTRNGNSNNNKNSNSVNNPRDVNAEVAINPISSKNIVRETDQSSLQLKTEQSDNVGMIYNPYPNIYQQNSTALFQPQTNIDAAPNYGSVVATDTALQQNQVTNQQQQQPQLPQHQDHQLTPQHTPPPTYNVWNAHHNPNNSITQHHQQHVQQQIIHHQQQQKHQLLQGAVIATNGIQTAAVAAIPNMINVAIHEQQQLQICHPQDQQQAQHGQSLSPAIQPTQQEHQPHQNHLALTSNVNNQYSVLGMQTEASLTTECSLSISTSSTGINNTTAQLFHTAAQNTSPSNRSYPSLIGQMKGDYSTYADFGAAGTYPSAVTAAAATVAFHHPNFHHSHHHAHTHNPWAYHQHPHITA